MDFGSKYLRKKSLRRVAKNVFIHEDYHWPVNDIALIEVRQFSSKKNIVKFEKVLSFC